LCLSAFRLQQKVSLPARSERTASALWVPPPRCIVGTATYTWDGPVHLHCAGIGTGAGTGTQHMPHRHRHRHPHLSCHPDRDPGSVFRPPLARMAVHVPSALTGAGVCVIREPVSCSTAVMLHVMPTCHVRLCSVLSCRLSFSHATPSARMRASISVSRRQSARPPPPPRAVAISSSALIQLKKAFLPD